MKTPNTVLVLRTCDADLRSYNGFQWPAKGPVECPDWKPVAECGNGLHGLLWGMGSPGYLSDNETAKWLVVSVLEQDILDIDAKVKFPRGEVVFCDERTEAVAYIQKRVPKHQPVLFGKYPRRFTKLDAADKPLLKSARSWSAVRDNLTGLIWMADDSSHPMNHSEAMRYTKKLGNGYRLPTHQELMGIVDARRSAPMINTDYFRTTGWWYWPSTPYRGSSDYAWIVRFSDGSSGAGNRGHLNYVRAVRASQ